MTLQSGIRAHRRVRALVKHPSSPDPLVVGSLSLPPARRPSPNFRALTIFDTLPAHHVTFLARDQGSAPHVRQGEYVVVDTGDREPVHGELFVIQWESGARRRAIVQTRADRLNITGPGAPKSLVWWVGDLVRFASAEEVDGLVTAARRRGRVPVLGGLSEGPFRTENLRVRLIGRVVGVAFSPLEELLAPAAGWQDEELGNAAFDPVEYVDVLVATGHEPTVILDEDGEPEWYCEKMPERRLSAEEDAAFMVVRWKYVRASTALARVKAECLRRGLVVGRGGAL